MRLSKGTAMEILSKAPGYPGGLQGGNVLSEQKNYVLPTPIIDYQEEQTVEALAVRYGQMQNPNLLSKADKKL